MKSIHTKLLVQLITSFLFITGIHFSICKLTPFDLGFSLISFYSILLLGTLLVFELTYWNHHLLPNQLNVGFFFGTLLKAALVYIFLIRTTDMTIIMHKIHIIVLYFMSLFVEIFILIRLLNTEKEYPKE